jgi:hypothetical protein
VCVVGLGGLVSPAGHGPGLRARDRGPRPAGGGAPAQDPGPAVSPRRAGRRGAPRARPLHAAKAAK